MDITGPSIRRINNGFTLIELMITLAILAIILAVGVSSYIRMIDGTQNRKISNSLKASIAQTRSESITRGGNVRFCGSSNGNTCAGSWNDGWLIYHDNDTDTTLTNADTVLSWHANNYSGLAITGTDSDGAAATDFGFNYRGYPPQAITLNVNGRNANSTVQLYANGRVEIQ